MALSLIGGFLAVLAAAPAGAQTTESFALSSASLPGQSSVTWQGGLGNPPAGPNVWPDPITLSGQIDSSSGAISGATLLLPPMTQPPTEGETPTFTFSEVNPGTATGTYDATTGAVTLSDSLTLTFHIAGILTNTCVSTPINVALSGTYDSASENVTLATTSSFTIPQFPVTADCAALVAGGVNASPGGIPGSTGNAMTIALNGQFAPGLPTTTSLSAIPTSPQLAGTSVTLTATVSDPSGSGTPTGSVNFLDNGANIGTGALSSGTATLTTKTLPGGSNQLSAAYSGDPSYAASMSSLVPYTVTPLPSVNAALPSTITVPTSSAPPTVTALSPSAGPPGGGTAVTITGSGFTPEGTTVKFGITAATSVAVANSTSITVTSPAGTGTVDVTVSTPNGTSATSGTDLFSYGTPTVTAVSPNAGTVPSLGSVKVTITGTNFTSGSTVNFGTVPAADVTVNSSTSITATTKTEGTGTVDVTVTTPNGTSPTSSADQFTFGGLVVTAVSPSAGPAAGGTTVTITGTSFTGATAVDFGSTAAASFTVKSATSITATSPAGTAGSVVDITVTTPSGTSSAYSADRFAYGAPTVTGISPNAGPAAGATSVTITGTNFVTGATVEFGTTAATSKTVVSPTEITATSPAGTGTADVTVTNSAGTSATSSADQFTYGPTVTGVSPPSGATAGGTTVALTGTGFTGASAVDFGSTAATSFTFNSATSITAVSPKGSAGTVDVTVTTPGGTSPTSAADQFSYGAPTVAAVSPSAGPLSGDTTVTLTGTGLSGASAVKFGSSAATSFTVNSVTSITAVSPSTTTAGVVHVTVTTNGGTSSATAAANEFTYSAAPSVSSISPNKPTGAGTVVTITGANFTGASSVSFGSTAATSFTVNSDTSITAAAPSGTGTVDVTVSSPSGTSATWSGDQFAYGAPTVTSVSPNSGIGAGGTGVVIRGTGFGTGATVDFGTTPATSVIVVSSTEITALSPAGSAGVVNVTVTTPGGTSATSSADQFTYSASSSSPAIFDLTVTNPSAGQSWPSLYLTLVLKGISGQPSSNLTLSYQDSSGDWCPLTATGTKTTFTYYFSGVGSSCTSAPGSVSLGAGSSLTVPMELSYSSGTYLGAQSVTTTLYSGTCSSATSCTQSGSLNGSVVNAGTIQLAPLARLDATVTDNFPTRPATTTVRQGFDVFTDPKVAATASTTGVPTPTGSVSWLVDGSPITVAAATGGPAVSSVALSGGAIGEYLYDTANLAPGAHTLTTQYSGDSVFAPASLTETFTVLPAPSGAPYTCNVGGAPLAGYVTATAAPSPTLSGTNAQVTNIGVTLDVDPIAEYGIAGDLNTAPQLPVTFSLSPGGTATSVAVPTFAGRGTESDDIGTWAGMSASVPITGSPGSSVAVSLAGSFSYTFGSGQTGSGTLTCSPVSEGAPVATVPVAGNTLTASPNGGTTPGTAVTLTDTVSPASYTNASGTTEGVGGQVDFYDGTTDLGTVAVDTTTTDAAFGTATLTTNTLAAGDHQLTAVWSGGGGVPANSAQPIDYFVGTSTTTTLSSSATSPSNAADPVTFTATVTPSPGATTMPTGTVDFTQDGNPISSCTGVALSSDTPPVATCKLAFGPGQSHSIVASYNGDDTYVGSTSDPLTQATLPGADVAVSSSANPVGAGSNVTLTANVTDPSGAGTPTGTVDFLSGGKVKGSCASVPLNTNGTATCVASFSPGGTYFKVTAVYSGDTNYSGATSPVLRVETLAATTTTLTSSKNPSVAKKPVTFVAEVRPSSGKGANPQGYAGFFVNGTLDPACMLVPLGGGGRARCTLTLTAGTHKVYAVYAGGTAYSASTSKTINQKVNAAAKKAKAKKKK